MAKNPLVVPCLAEGVSDVRIGRWTKKPGDCVAAGEPIVELEGDKASVEHGSPVAGVLIEVVAKEGDVVPIGAVLAIIDESPLVEVAEAVAPEAPPRTSARPGGVIAMDKPHVVILGAGTAGFAAAMRLAQLGHRVTLIDRAPAPGGRAYSGGGTARLSMLESSSRHLIARAELEASTPPLELAVNMAAMRARAREVETTFTQALIMLCRSRRVAYVRGHGRVRDRRCVEVLDPNGEVTQTIECSEVILATGTVAAVPPGVVVDGEWVVDGQGEGPLSFVEVPRSLAVIGASTTGLEWALAFAQLGADVTVIDARTRLLPHLDEDVARFAARALARRGVKLCLGGTVVGAQRAADGVETTFEQGESRRTLRSDRALVAAGRRPSTADAERDALPLERLTNGAFVVDEQHHTKMEGVWAVGGATRSSQRSTTMDAIAVAELLSGHDAPAVRRPRSEVIHLAMSEVAWVGESEAALAADGVTYRTGRAPFLANPRARVMSAGDGLVKLLVHAGSDRVLGAQIVGAAAGELVSEIALAISLGASADDLARLPRAPGTLAEALGEAARSASGWPLMLLK